MRLTDSSRQCTKNIDSQWMRTLQKTSHVSTSTLFPYLKSHIVHSQYFYWNTSSVPLFLISIDRLGFRAMWHWNGYVTLYLFQWPFTPQTGVCVCITLNMDSTPRQFRHKQKYIVRNFLQRVLISLSFQFVQYLAQGFKKTEVKKK